MNKFPFFKPVQSEKVAQDILRQIENAILGGEVETGERLPPSRELEKIFKASRSTVRQVLKVLEQKGMVNIKPGSAGGTYITNSGNEKVGENLAMLFSLGDVTVRQLYEFRELNEVLAFESAVQQATEKEIAALKKLFGSLKTSYKSTHKDAYEKFFVIEKSLHAKVLTMAKNPLSIWVMETTMTYMWRYLAFTWDFRTVEKTEKTSLMTDSLRDWEEIVQAFEDRNNKYASDLARFHSMRYYRAFKKYLVDKSISENTLIKTVYEAENRRKKTQNKTEKSYERTNLID
jgi:GntR family transcriptional regulator, transcriptional repressor for pyruvate dehydrogenase complex